MRYADKLYSVKEQLPCPLTGEKGQAAYPGHAIKVEISQYYLISVNLPPVPKAVIPEAILIGNPASKRLKL